MFLVGQIYSFPNNVGNIKKIDYRFSDIIFIFYRVLIDFNWIKAIIKY